MATRCLSRSLLIATRRNLLTIFSSSYATASFAVIPNSSSSLLRLRPIVAAVSASYFRRLTPALSTRGFATRQTSSSLNDPNPNWSNRPPKETILLDGCDFEHWLVVLEKPEGEPTRDEIIDSYIKTLAMVVGSEEEARMKIYSVSTRHYFAFGALVSEELSYKIKELPKVRWVLPDSYLDVRNKDYGGEPFINGQAVPYDPKYHEEWVRNNARANERNRRNDRPRNFDRSRNYERRRDMQMGNQNVGGPGGNMGGQPNLGGPGGNMGGQPNVGGPGGNMGGQPNVGGPGGNMGGQPNMGGIPPNIPNTGAMQPNLHQQPNNMGGQPNMGGIPSNMPNTGAMQPNLHQQPTNLGGQPNSGGVPPYNPGYYPSNNTRAPYNASNQYASGPNSGGMPYQSGPGPNQSTFAPPNRGPGPVPNPNSYAAPNMGPGPSQSPNMGPAPGQYPNRPTSNMGPGPAQYQNNQSPYMGQGQGYNQNSNGQNTGSGNPSQNQNFPGRDYPPPPNY